MHLANALLRELETSGLSLAERARLRCRLAKQLERGGDYSGAEAALSEFWDGIGTRPRIDDLDAETGAHMLLRTGTVTGWLGASEQVEGSQESAKDLISESARAFEGLGSRANAAEAQTDLALCYWREGAFDEARVILQDVLSELSESDIEQRAIALLRLSLVEQDSKRLSEALRIHSQAAPLFERIKEPLLIAGFHLGFGNLLNELSSIEREYVDRALIEYTAASVNYELAGHERYQACVENNLAYLYCTIGEFDKAHEHSDRAQMIATRLKDDVHIAQFDETRARVLLAEGRIIEAEKTVRSAVVRLEKGDHLSLFAEALITHGIALARLDHPGEAKVSFGQAINVAEHAGDFESAGIAALTLVEQLGATLSAKEVLTALDRAGVLLEKSRDLNTVRRLAKAAYDALPLTQSPEHWQGFSLKTAVDKYRGRLIKLALEVSGGSVTRAGRLLGMHHQSLTALIESRHPELTSVRKPVRPRRKRLFSPPRRSKK